MIPFKNDLQKKKKKIHISSIFYLNISTFLHFI